MILKYSDFYTLIKVIKNNSINNMYVYNYFYLFSCFNYIFKYNLISVKQFKALKINNYINFNLLKYLYKFYNLYMEIFLIKYSNKKYLNMYLYLNFFNFFFKFLNWYYNFLLLNSNIFILDNNILSVLDHKIIGNSNLFVNFLNNYNCKFFINLDSKISKDHLRLFYESDIYVLDLSICFDYKYNKNNLLQLLFLVRNLVLFTKFFHNI